MATRGKVVLILIIYAVWHNVVGPFCIHLDVLLIFVIYLSAEINSFSDFSASVYFVKCFSYKDLKKATDRFKRIQDSSINGTTYRAKFHNGHIAVVKEIRMFDNLDDDAFCRKVQLLSRLHHRHIASLSGYSAGNKRF